MPRLKRLVPSRRRHLDAGAISAVVTIIDGWPEGSRMIWDALTDKVGEIVGHRWTRQALERSPTIKAAYLASVERSRSGLPKKVVDPADVVMARRSEALAAEIGELKRKLAAYEERFVRHIHNAQNQGISAGQLAAPMPAVDRRQTDVERPEKRTAKGR